MSDVVLDAKRWARCIKRSPVLSSLLNDRDFLREQIDKVLTMYRGEASVIPLIRGLMFVLEDDRRVIEAVDGITNDSTERKSLLHWFAISVYATARELNLVHSRTTIGGNRNE